MSAKQISLTRLAALATAAAVLTMTALIRPATALTVHSCGATLKSVVKTETSQFTTQSTTFVSLPGAAVTVVVPAGETRCVKARLYVVASCTETAANDLCAIRMDDVGIGVFDPAINGIDIAPGGVAPAAYAFQWVKVLGEGTHQIRPRIAVQNAMTTFTIKFWTFDVETAE
jgi:hypothetical protein